MVHYQCPFINKKDRCVYFKVGQAQLCVLVLNSFWGRFLGAQRFLTGHQACCEVYQAPMPILFFPRTRIVHQFFSSQELYVVFIDHKGRVLHQGWLQPRRFMGVWTAYGVLECHPQQQSVLEQLIVAPDGLRRLFRKEEGGGRRSQKQPLGYLSVSSCSNAVAVRGGEK